MIRYFPYHFNTKKYLKSVQVYGLEATTVIVAECCAYELVVVGVVKRKKTSCELLSAIFVAKLYSVSTTLNVDQLVPSGENSHNT